MGPVDPLFRCELNSNAEAQPSGAHYLVVKKPANFLAGFATRSLRAPSRRVCGAKRPLCSPQIIASRLGTTLRCQRQIVFLVSPPHLRLDAPAGRGLELVCLLSSNHSVRLSGWTHFVLSCLRSNPRRHTNRQKIRLIVPIFTSRLRDRIRLGTKNRQSSAPLARTIGASYISRFLLSWPQNASLPPGPMMPGRAGTCQAGGQVHHPVRRKTMSTPGPKMPGQVDASLVDLSVGRHSF